MRNEFALLDLGDSIINRDGDRAYVSANRPPLS